ncbi:MAG: glutamine-synthetase adenylyltransferase [Aquificaceae bacterium]
MFPSEWWYVAEKKLINQRKTKESIEKLLKNHKEPKGLIDYLNQRRFVLLLELLDHSECIRNFLINNPEEFQKVIPGLWYLTKKKEDYLRELEGMLSGCYEDQEFSKRLAHYRHRELMRILSKEILGTAKLEDLLAEYSYLPDAMMEVCYRRALEEMKDLFGTPTEEDGRESTGCIIALGKLGSLELNYYSDIDIMFLHSSDKGTAGRLTLSEFFSKVFQKVLNLMNTTTSEGKPYEVDLDLRPFGRSGPISMSLRSAELYYESYGRTWERFALLRSRFSAGDEELYGAFERDVKVPFVFKRSTDWRMIEEIKLMKAQITAQAKGNVFGGLNIKTGEGGIRELEFTVQSLVLLLGGKQSFLRESNTFKAIWRLGQKGVFSDVESSFLEEAYEFLRRVEHKIQTYKCLQSQRLSKEDMPTIAKMLGYTKDEFEEKLKHYMEGVSKIFSSIIPSEEYEELKPIQQVVLAQDAELAKEVLSSLGFKNPLRAYNVLLSYVHGREGIKLSSSERRMLIQTLPKAIEYISQSPDPDETLSNFDKFFSNPTGRKVVLSPSKEDVLKKLCDVFSLSSYLSTLISRYPDLVEDLLTLYQDFPNESMLQEEFEKYKKTLNLSPENLFRRFKRVWEIRMILVYLTKEEQEYKKLVEFFENLTLLADFLMQRLWEMQDVNVALLALGKYGSSELSIGSDLDLVFLTKEYSPEHTKKAQEFIRFLTTHTKEGYLYDVDFRLRPMGTKGELVPSLEFYKEYFEKQARTWERIAWTRCRYIAGDKKLLGEFETLLKGFLFDRPLTSREKEEIKNMRFALESQAKKGNDIVDLKFGAGGILDGEFLIQYFILLDRLREPSMIKAYQKLMGRHSILKRAYENYMFLRLVETRLRLSKERGVSTLTHQDMKKVASSLGMDEKELFEEIKGRMVETRGLFLEVFD